MSNTFSRLRIALRLARRDLAAHKIRTVVALLLFALPVSLVVGFVSFTLGYDQALQNSPLNSVGHVSLDSDRGRPSEDPLTQETVASQNDDLTEAIGDLADSLSPGVLQRSSMTNGDRSADLNVITLNDSKDRTGPSIEPGTVLVNDDAAYLLGVDDGDTISVDGTELTVRAGGDYQGSVVSSDDVPVNQWAMDITWYFPADKDAAQSIVDAIRDVDGERINTTSIYDPHYSGSAYFDGDTAIAFFSFLVLGIVLVSAVITPVFAVAARRQRRAMGLLSANGAAPRDLRLIMLAEGLLVGLLGTCLGLILSTGVAAAFFAVAGLNGFHWSWIAAVSVALVALICGVTSALVPAVRAGREDPVQALADGGSERMTGFRWRMLIGLLFLIPGVLLALTSEQDTMTLGITLCGIGVVLSSSLIVWLLSRLGHVLPTAGRLAVRDSLRNNHRTIPAVAAIAGATFLATVVLAHPYNVGTESSFRDNVVVMSTTRGGDETSYASEIEQMSSRLNAESHHPLTEVQDVTSDGSTYNASLHTPPHPAPGLVHTAWATLRVTDGDIFTAYDGVDDSAVIQASNALADGKVVVSDPELVDDGEVLIELREYDPYYGYRPDHTGEDPGPADETLRIPAVVIPGLAGTGALDGAALAPDTAESLGLDVSYRGTVFLLDSPVTMFEAAAVATNLWPVVANYFSVDTPAVDGDRALLVSTTIVLSWVLTLGTVLLVVLLAATESRRDMATITAVGAPPGLLRRFAATQAVFIATAGTVVGVVVGILPRFSQTVSTVTSTSFSIGFLTPSQWLALGLTAVVGPVLAWIAGSVIGAVTSRDRSPVRRR